MHDLRRMYFPLPGYRDESGYFRRRCECVPKETYRHPVRKDQSGPKNPCDKTALLLRYLLHFADHSPTNRVARK